MDHYCGQLAIQHLTVGPCMELITTPRAFPAAYHVQNIKCHVQNRASKISLNINTTAQLFSTQRLPLNVHQKQLAQCLTCPSPHDLSLPSWSAELL